MGEARRKRAEEALAEGRRLLESGDVHGALRLLDRARKDFVQEGDLAGVRELRKVVEDGYRLADAQDEPAYERLLYASAQNIRFLSRKRAVEAKVPWEDPHPELDQPGRPEMRAERGVTKRDVPWIAIAAVAGVLVLAGVGVYIFAMVQITHVRVRNDSNGRVFVGFCGDECQPADATHAIDPGATRDMGHDFGDDVLAVRTEGKSLRCIVTGGWHPTVSVSRASYNDCLTILAP